MRSQQTSGRRSCKSKSHLGTIWCGNNREAMWPVCSVCNKLKPTLTAIWTKEQQLSPNYNYMLWFSKMFTDMPGPLVIDWPSDTNYNSTSNYTLLICDGLFECVYHLYNIPLQLLNYYHEKFFVYSFMYVLTFCITVLLYEKYCLANRPTLSPGRLVPMFSGLC